MFSIIFLYTLCALSFTISKAVLSYSAPIFFVGVREVLAGLILLTFLIVKKASFRSIRNNIFLFMVIIIGHVYIPYIADLWSLQYITSSKSSLFFNLSPFITALLSFFFLHERLTIKQWFGLLIGFIGFFPLLIKTVPLEEVVGSFFHISVPEIVLLISVTSSCVGWIFFKQLLEKNYSAFFINGVSMTIGGLLALFTSMFVERWFVQSPVSAFTPFIILTVLIIFVCNILFYNLYGYLLTFYSTTFLSLAGLITPLLTALFGFLFLGEKPTWHFFLAILFISFGLFIFYQDELLKAKKGHRISSAPEI